MLTRLFSLFLFNDSETSSTLPLITINNLVNWELLREI
jgi:hypothetical protein